MDYQIKIDSIKSGNAYSNDWTRIYCYKNHISSQWKLVFNVKKIHPVCT